MIVVDWHTSLTGANGTAKAEGRELQTEPWEIALPVRFVL